MSLWKSKKLGMTGHGKLQMGKERKYSWKCVSKVLAKEGGWMAPSLYTLHIFAYSHKQQSSYDT